MKTDPQNLTPLNRDLKTDPRNRPPSEMVTRSIVSRFLESFQEELKREKVVDTSRVLLIGQYFDDDLDGVVRHFFRVKIGEVEYRLCSDHILFDPNEPFDRSVERMGDLFGLPKTEAESRLKRVYGVTRYPY